MCELGVKPDLVTYVMLFSSMCRRSRESEVQMLMKKMKEDNLSPNENIYTSLIGMYTNLKQLSGAMNAFSELVLLDIAPSPFIYGALLGMLIVLFWGACLFFFSLLACLFVCLSFCLFVCMFFVCLFVCFALFSYSYFVS
jgi:pentatricopeptide repeat protein